MQSFRIVEENSYNMKVYRMARLEVNRTYWAAGQEGCDDRDHELAGEPASECPPAR